MLTETETIRVTWTTDVEVPIGTLDRAIAQRVADDYFQDRIAAGEADTACVFHVNGVEVDLSITPTRELNLAEAAQKVLDELQAIEDSGDIGRALDMDGKSSIIALKRLIKQTLEGA